MYCASRRFIFDRCLKVGVGVFCVVLIQAKNRWLELSGTLTRNTDFSLFTVQERHLITVEFARFLRDDVP